MLKKFALVAIAIAYFLPCFATYSFDKLSLEEKVGQVFMVHFHGEDANQDAKTLIQDLHVGGIIYYNWSNGLSNPEQIERLSTGLQEIAKSTPNPIPLLIATDQEGGIVARLTKGFTVFPGNKALGMTHKPLLAKESAFVMGEELKAVGVNMNLSPVVDINNNPKNPMIGVRSFGETPETVVSFADKALEGYHLAHVITSLKHFPGHGDVEIDSHLALPIINKSKEELTKNELYPFLKLAKHADTIMTAHILIPALDAKNCATLSPKILKILREEIGFQGVIISDSLVMEGLLKNCSSVEDATIRAFNAGCDILLLGGKQLVGEKSGFELTVSDVERIQKTFVQAVKKGVISSKRLDEALQRILTLKNRYLADTAPSNLKLSDLNSPLHQELSRKIASLAVKVVKKDSPSLPFMKGNYAVFAPFLIKETLLQSSFAKPNTPLFFFNDQNPLKEEIDAAIKIANKSDTLLFFTYNAWKSKMQSDFFQGLFSVNKPVIVVALRDSLDVTLFPDAEEIIITFSPTLYSIDAAYQNLVHLETVEER